MDGQLDVIGGDDPAPSLFNLEENFSFHAAEFHVQLVSLQDFGICEDSLFLIAMEGRS